ncbi:MULTISPECIES: helix-turn-helix domain-containing protein [Cysteiniphilum]|uniref:HTH cro/C1-type domain-containing protein n=1 Tax=Cysteiniphilum litorale TaxID=2056700 RepID=A0A8J2Z7D5_9GAMM|nr:MULTISPECIES: helix-turn-helix transcriptional regulator [Cysteiniphilum]GGG08912.1 hypothetical protein GCM10010995_28120 [Cysteiniphilum litorale]
MKSFDDYLKENYTQAEIDLINQRALQKANSYMEFKNSIAYALKNYMEEKHIGFSEIKKELGTSDSQTSRILKGDTNFTAKTIFKIAEVIGKSPRIIFE